MGSLCNCNLSYLRCGLPWNCSFGFFFIVPLFDGGGHLFSSLNLKFLAINSCFVGIIVRNFHMVSRLDPTTILVFESIVLGCFRWDGRFRGGNSRGYRFRMFRRDHRFRGAMRFGARLHPTSDTPLKAGIVNRVASNVAI